MKNLFLTLSRNILLTIYKTFVRPILDYSNIIYDKSLTESFQDKLEMLQYNAALVITGLIKGTSRDRIYRKLEYLAQRWCRKIFFFHKIINSLSPVYLQSYISYCGEGVEEWNFSLIVLKSGIILVKGFRKLNQQFNLK